MEYSQAASDHYDVAVFDGAVVFCVVQAWWSLGQSDNGRVKLARFTARSPFLCRRHLGRQRSASVIPGFTVPHHHALAGDGGGGGLL